VVLLGLVMSVSGLMLDFVNLRPDPLPAAVGQLPAPAARFYIAAAMGHIYIGTWGTPGAYTRCATARGRSLGQGAPRETGQGPSNGVSTPSSGTAAQTGATEKPSGDSGNNPVQAPAGQAPQPAAAHRDPGANSAAPGR
jgi:type IV secretory pathway TrbL component